MRKKIASGIVSETSEAIVQVLLQGYMSPPETKEQWKNIAQDFGDLWQFPHVVGAIDGWHVGIEAPAKSICIRIIKERLISLFYNHLHYILRLSDVLPNFSFTTRETMGDYY